MAHIQRHFNKFYVAYSRCSTKDQGDHGYSLEYQKKEIDEYSLRNKGIILKHYQEVVSGRSKKKRSIIFEAIAHCKRDNAILLVYKLDRFARDLAFLQQLYDSGIQYHFMDFPGANKFVLNVMMAVAEYEATLISERTKIGLQYARESGKQLGGYRENSPGKEYLQALAQAQSDKAKESPENKRAYAVIESLKDSFTLSDIAKTLNKNHFTTRKGNPFDYRKVARLIKMYQKEHENNRAE